MNNQFPKGIEVVSSAIIRNEKGEIFFARAPKWSNKWTLPGGHIEPGETIEAAALREAKEETGFDLKPVALITSGELINSKDCLRPAHWIYFNYLLDKVGGELTLEQKELSDFIWVTPEEALKLDLAESFDQTVREYIAYCRHSREGGNPAVKNHIDPGSSPG
jgi:nucleoside triphosphatase